MMIELTLFMHMAAACAPTVAPETLAAIARTESGLNPFAIFDNDTRRGFRPDTLEEAQAIAAPLVATGHSVDVGLMQMNSHNFSRLGLSVAQALDPCRSLAAGARLLVDAYQGGTTDTEQQQAVRIALSRYNTGDARLGFANGYVRKVEASTRYIVPALTVTSDQVSASRPNPPTAATPPENRPGWDVWAQAADAATAAAPGWDASPDARNATAASFPTAPLDPPRSAEARVVMLQAIPNPEKK
jgi:type IV secretion system protein VirB1